MKYPIGIQDFKTIENWEKCFDSIDFRIWSRQILKEYIVKGFVLDDDRFIGNNQFGEEYFSDLLDRIWEIQLSERSIYQKITDIFAEFSCDYDPHSIPACEFYSIIKRMMYSSEVLKSNHDRLAEIFIHKAEYCSKQKILMRMADWKLLLEGFSKQCRII